MKIGYMIDTGYEIASDPFATSAEAYEALDKRKWNFVYEIGFLKSIRYCNGAWYIMAKRM